MTTQTYYTTLNSGLKFIDQYVNTNNWTECANNDGVYEANGDYKLTTVKVDNVNVFTLTKENKPIQISDLPINLRVNMVLNGSNERTFKLEEKVLTNDITAANATLGFDPKYFIYDSSNKCYTIDSEAIILDHDVSACTGVIAVSVFEVNEEGIIDTTKPSNYISAEIDSAKRQLNIGVSNVVTGIIDYAITNITSSNEYITVDKTDNHTYNISFDDTKIHTYTATSGHYINVSTTSEGKNDNFTISLNANVNTTASYTVNNELDTFIAVAKDSDTVALPSTVNVSDDGVQIKNDGGDLNVYVGSGKKINFYINGSIIMSIGSEN
jgi:hypothetical protein